MQCTGGIDQVQSALLVLLFKLSLISTNSFLLFLTKTRQIILQFIIIQTDQIKKGVRVLANANKGALPCLRCKIVSCMRPRML